VRLKGEGISPIHCILKTVNGQLCVQDWYTSVGTRINGAAVLEDVIVQPGDEIQVGGYVLTMTTACAPPVPDNSPATTTAAEPVPFFDLNTDWDLDQDLPSATDGFADDQGTCSSSVDQESLDLLHAEVERLQEELALREQEVLELRTGPEQNPRAAADPLETAEQTAKLVSRMEQLLDELDQSDARIAQLLELLRHSEEAARAEREERAQIEAWVSDIERRVGEREAERKAEHEILEQRMQEVVQQRDRLQTQLRRQPLPDERGGSRDRESQQLRDEHLRLQQEIERLQGLLESERQSPARVEAAVAAARSEMAAELREQSVTLSQERALLARQQQELATARSELQRAADAQQRPEADADMRLRVFRDHLREIHSQELNRQTDRTLGSRLAQLWRRIEKRD
jgi:chromosome segregation ATPase